MIVFLFSFFMSLNSICPLNVHRCSLFLFFCNFLLYLKKKCLSIVTCFINSTYFLKSSECKSNSLRMMKNPAFFLVIFPFDNKKIKLNHKIFLFPVLSSLPLSSSLAVVNNNNSVRKSNVYLDVPTMNMQHLQVSDPDIVRTFSSSNKGKYGREM